jgi:hypothetical protein
MIAEARSAVAAAAAERTGVSGMLTGGSRARDAVQRCRVFRSNDSMTGETLRTEDDVMEMAASDVLLDPAFTVPAVPEAAAGVGWIRCNVARFCEGTVHSRRRDLTERVIAWIGRPERLSSPTATLLDAMGLPTSLEPDVAAVALAYQPHVLVPPEADEAADRLVAACGGHTEESAARVCVLIQAHAATLALIARLQAGDGEPAVPVTRRVAPGGQEILVDLATAPFGAGRHACPGHTLALHLAGTAEQETPEST